MDLKAKSWVGNICHKFDDFCSDVEEVMSQETVKYVENKFHKAGVRVKKFYSEVMQDISYTHEAMEKKLKSSIKEHRRCIDDKFKEDTQVIKSGKSKHVGVYKRHGVGVTSNSLDIDPPMKMARTSFSPSGMRNMRVFDRISDTNIPTIGTSKDVAASESEKKLSDEICEQKPEDLGLTSSFHCQSSKSTGTHMNDDAISEADSVSCPNTIGNEPVDREQNSDSDKLKKTDGIQQEVETVEQIKGSNLVETCVIVEEDKLHVPNEPVKQKSYKNKIWNAFSSRRRLTVKEYEELAALYADQPLNAEAKEKANAMLSATEFPDSEWEFL